MRTALIGVVLLVVGAVAVATGALPLDDLGVLYERVWPILLFVVAITVVTELASEAGLFTWIAERAAGLGRGRTWALWLATVVLACLCTIFLSLDTTAVLLTPVVVVLARHCGLPPLPFALTTVWLANTASLLLPVSNLTNLLAEHELGGLGPAGFAALTVAPALVAIAVPVLAILVIHRKDLFTRYEVGPPTAPTDRVLLVAAPWWWGSSCRRSSRASRSGSPRSPRPSCSRSSRPSAARACSGSGSCRGSSWCSPLASSS
ncbi:Arsenical pump membrane protein [Clavibacter michiganensis subsp. michiganensis]|uniref:Arsenical pump membrane protein n=1 Tax=Clavibacter michiganensis subsp. michiganensis TaxID=33013 RepID=A0A251XHK9_CLAMM|nr:Arsenical pump membrane protein [Clavibacter michiganensis subsp. michiganensis]OUE01677.1 Arsenical pump membrane protein [Clavibacter michiganensis subsp. michiganensis]